MVTAKENRCHTFPWEPGWTSPNIKQQWLILNVAGNRVTHTPVVRIQNNIQTYTQAQLVCRGVRLFTKSRATVLGGKMCSQILRPCSQYKHFYLLARITSWNQVANCFKSLGRSARFTSLPAKWCWELCMVNPRDILSRNSDQER